MKTRRPLTETDKAIVRALQKDLPLVPEPYKQVAHELGISEEELLSGIERLMEEKRLKRISIALRHKNVGYTWNVMGAWDIPDDEIDRVGQAVANHRYVTHCYRRGRSEHFPYNLYTMLHARSGEECEEIIRTLEKDIAELVGYEVPHDMLRSMTELKKIGMKYFIEDPKDIIEA